VAAATAAVATAAAGMVAEVTGEEGEEGGLEREVGVMAEGVEREEVASL
jgi:hypothetical protein